MSPVPLAKFQMAPIPSTLMSSRSKKKEPRYVYLNEAKASHSHKMWTEVSSSVPHFLQVGLSHIPIICRCLLKVLCPVRRPVTTLDCVLLKDNNRGPCSQIRAGDQFSILSLYITGTTPQCQMLFLHPACSWGCYNMFAVGCAGQLGWVAETLAYMWKLFMLRKQLIASLGIRSSWLKAVVLDCINCKYLQHWKSIVTNARVSRGLWLTEFIWTTVIMVKRINVCDFTEHSSMFCGHGFAVRVTF